MQGIRYVVLLLVILVLFGCWYCFYSEPVALTVRETSGKTMGTVYTVKATDVPRQTDWGDVEDAIQTELAHVDNLMSTYKDNSDVCRFNAFRQADEWFFVSQETAFVVQKSLEVSEQSGGAFDITVAPLVSLWGFGAQKTNQSLETRTLETLKVESLKLKENTGYEKLSVQRDPPALKKSIPLLSIDLSAIAKGYAVDKVAELLEKRGFKNYMVEVGGEVRCGGTKLSADDWNIGIEKPLSENFVGLQRKITLYNQSLAASGGYRQEHIIDGKRVSHFIDPRSGLPTSFGNNGGDETLGSVSVIADECMIADAWATAFFVLGEEEGRKMNEKQNFSVLFLLHKNNVIRESGTGIFSRPVQ